MVVLSALNHLLWNSIQETLKMQLPFLRMLFLKSIKSFVEMFQKLILILLVVVLGAGVSMGQKERFISGHLTVLLWAGPRLLLLMKLAMLYRILRKGQWKRGSVIK